MKNQEDNIRNFIKKTLSEIDMAESDLIVRKDAGQTWDNLSLEFKKEVDALINSISEDRYKNALDEISVLMATLKMWRHRILNGVSKNKKGEDEYNMSRFSLEESLLNEDRPQYFQKAYYGGNTINEFEKLVKKYYPDAQIVGNAAYNGETKVGVFFQGEGEIQAFS